MSRPKPKIILEYVHPTTYKSEQVLEASAIYAVFYNGRPINVRQMLILISNPAHKYRKTAFSNPGHAFNLAEKLNKIHKTDRFTVHRLTQGEQVTEEELKDELRD